MLKLIAVQNNSRVGVIRANLLFPAGKVVTVLMDISTSRYKEVKACSSLKVVGMEDYVEPAPVVLGPVVNPVVTKVTEQSVVVEPEVTTKVEEPAPEPESVPEPESAPAPEPESAPAPEPEPELVLDVEPIVVAPEPPVEDVAELEVAAEAVVEESVEVVEEPISYSCPYCGEFEAPKKISALNHVRSKHPDMYDAYKESFTK